ncbi:MAG: hypothetical protein ACLQOO_04600 [Terriglobia bacterium]
MHSHLTTPRANVKSIQHCQHCRNRAGAPAARLLRQLRLPFDKVRADKVAQKIEADTILPKSAVKREYKGGLVRSLRIDADGDPGPEYSNIENTVVEAVIETVQARRPPGQEGGQPVCESSGTSR